MPIWPQPFQLKVTWKEWGFPNDSLWDELDVPFRLSGNIYLRKGDWCYSLFDKLDFWVKSGYAFCLCNAFGLVPFFFSVLMWVFSLISWTRLTTWTSLFASLNNGSDLLTSLECASEQRITRYFWRRFHFYLFFCDM